MCLRGFIIQLQAIGWRSLLCVLGLLCVHSISFGEVPRLAVVSDRVGAELRINDVSVGHLPSFDHEGRTVGAAVVMLPNWEWHGIEVLDEGIKASGPRIVRAERNQLVQPIYLFSPKETIPSVGPSVLNRLDVLRALPSTLPTDPPAVVEPDVLDDDLDHDQIEFEPVASKVPARAHPTAIFEIPRTGTINVHLPRAVQAGDVVRLVEAATGDVIASNMVKPGEAVVEFSHVAGLRLYVAELLRAESRIGSSAAQVLGRDGIWSLYLRIADNQPVMQLPRPNQEERLGPKEIHADFQVSVRCPSPGDFEDLYAALHARLHELGVRWASSVTRDEVDAYLSSYGYPEGGPMLKGQPVARSNGRPVVYAERIYIFLFRDYKLATSINAAHLPAGDSR